MPAPHKEGGDEGTSGPAGTDDNYLYHNGICLKIIGGSTRAADPDSTDARIAESVSNELYVRTKD